MHGMTHLEQARAYRDIRRKFFPPPSPVVRPRPAETAPLAVEFPHVIVVVGPTYPEVPADAAVEDRVEIAIRLAREMFVRNPGIKRTSMICVAVAHAFGLTPTDITCKLRTAVFIEPRHIAYAICMEWRVGSLPEIGQWMRRDHTTILYGARKKLKLVQGVLERIGA